MGTTWSEIICDYGMVLINDIRLTEELANDPALFSEKWPFTSKTPFQCSESRRRKRPGSSERSQSTPPTPTLCRRPGVSRQDRDARI